VEALKTYIELLKHPLVVKVGYKEKWQCQIRTTSDETKVLAIDQTRSVLVDGLSPVFCCQEDGIKAISDIGKDKLLFMFKTLKGL
jgi:hypothetical protein